MGIRKKINEIFIDNTDLEIAHHEIGYLRDLCDAKDKIITSKDMTIAYQSELLNIQGESIKRYRLLEEELNGLKEEMKNEKSQNTKRKSVRLPKAI